MIHVNPLQVKTRVPQGWSIKDCTPPRVENGAWDLIGHPLTTILFVRSLDDMDRLSIPFEETDYYKSHLATIEGGKPMWGCHDKAEWDKRIDDLKCLHAEIFLGEYRDCSEPEDRVGVAIGRYGQLMLNNGRHRFAIARLAKRNIPQISDIPVNVNVRHQKWAELRKAITGYSNERNGLYSPVDHPDLSHLPSHHDKDDERWGMIYPHLHQKEGHKIRKNERWVLDIGAHWGYFTFKMARFYEHVTAIESDPFHYNILQTLCVYNDAGEPVRGDVLEIEKAYRYNVVLALNIFHHFIKTEGGHYGLKKLLQRLTAMDVMFFQSHKPKEGQMAGAFRNYGPEEFASFIVANSKLKHAEEIGKSSDGRKLYKIWR